MPGDTNTLKREYVRLQIDLQNVDSKLRETVDHLVKCDLVALPKENADPELSGAYHLLLKTTSDISEKLEMPRASYPVMRPPELSRLTIGPSILRATTCAV
jgi:hypothetical protein